MKFIYILGFNIDGNGGRSKVSREKATSLKKIVGDENFDVWYPKDRPSKIIKYLEAIFFDLICAVKLLFIKGKGSYVIHRVIFFPFSSLVMRLKGVASAYEVHADFAGEIGVLNKGFIEKAILKALTVFDAFNYKMNSGIIYNHPNLQEKLSLKYRKPSIYTYNGVNANVFISTDKKQSRNELGLDLNKKIALFLGSISQWHGVDLLIDAFNNDVLSKSERMELLIVGASKNTYVDSLKAKANGNKNIKFVNRVNTEDAVRYINASDLCLLPVKQIRLSPGSPLKLYEYASCGRPIITQENIIAYSDEIAKYELGFVTDFTDPQQAAKDISNALSTDNEDFYRKNNRKQAEEHLSWDNRMQQWINFYQKIN